MKKTLLFFTGSIGLVLFCILVASSIKLSKTENTRHSASKSAKKTTLYSNLKDIKTLRIAPLPVNAESNIRFDVVFNDTKEIQLTYNAFTEPDTDRVDLKKITWEKSGEVLTLQFNDAMEIGRQYSPKLSIQIPRRDWHVEDLKELGKKAYFTNNGSPISLTLSNYYKLSINGNYQHLNAWRGGGSCYSCTEILGTLETIDIYSSGTNHGSMIDIKEKTTFKALNIHADKKNHFKIGNLSWLPKIHWSELTEAERAKLIPKKRPQ